MQRSLLAARLHNVQCRKVDAELATSYSLHDARVFEEKVFMGRAMFEPLARVRVHGGIAYVTNPEGLFRSRSVYLMGGIEYPILWGATFEADFIRDVKQHGDWGTLQVTKRHRLGSLRHGAIFYYRHGLGATGTRHLPGNTNTESITGVPSVFYRSLLEIDDGPVTWYMEVSPHVQLCEPGHGSAKTSSVGRRRHADGFPVSLLDPRFRRRSVRRFGTLVLHHGGRPCHRRAFRGAP